MSKEKIEFYKKPSVFTYFNDPYHKGSDFIEVTEWSNGEGWDVQINDDKHFSLHDTEFEMLKKLIKKLDKFYKNYDEDDYH